MVGCLLVIMILLSVNSLLQKLHKLQALRALSQEIASRAHLSDKVAVPGHIARYMIQKPTFLENEKLSLMELDLDFPTL